MIFSPLWLYFADSKCPSIAFPVIIWGAKSGALQKRYECKRNFGLTNSPSHSSLYHKKTRSKDFFEKLQKEKVGNKIRYNMDPVNCINQCLLHFWMRWATDNLLVNLERDSTSTEDWDRSQNTDRNTNSKRILISVNMSIYRVWGTKCDISK